MLKRTRLSVAVRRDILEIWLYTAREFGEAQADKYDQLLMQAISDIDENPQRPGSRALPQFGATTRSYRVATSVKRSGTGIHDSQHVVVFVELPDGSLGVSRILHEAMDFSKHLPEDADGAEDFSG